LWTAKEGEKDAHRDEWRESNFEKLKSSRRMSPQPSPTRGAVLGSGSTHLQRITESDYRKAAGVNKRDASGD